MRGALLPDTTRSDANLPSGCLLILDADASQEDAQSAPPPLETHQILEYLNINHLIYTSHSHSKELNRYRVLIPCALPHKGHLAPTLRKLFSLLEACESTLLCVDANLRWSQPCYVGNRDEDDGLFEHYSFYDGEDFNAEPAEQVQQGSIYTGEHVAAESSIQDIISGDDYHSAINRLTGRYIQKGMKVEETVVVVQALMHKAWAANPDQDKARWQERYDDIERSAKGAVAAGWGEKKIESSAMLDTKSGNELNMLKFRELQYAVKDILLEGTCLFYGKPKKGKSWLSYCQKWCIRDLKRRPDLIH